jgi:hypothetical protein
MEDGIIAVKPELVGQIFKVRKWAKRLRKAKTTRDVQKVLKRYCRLRKIQYVALDLNVSPDVPFQSLVQCVNCRRVKNKSNVVQSGSVTCPVDGLKREAFTPRQCTYHRQDRLKRALV